jgi:hypothetical protein
MTRWRARIEDVVARIERSSVRQFLVLLALAVAVRAGSFTQIASDWDDAVYVLMARSMLAGHAPYTAVWDHKPPGIYCLFALVEAAGGSVIAIRVLTCLALAATAWAILRIWNTLFGVQNRRGWIAALMFLGLAQRYLGNAVNTEYFFVAFVALGFALLLPFAYGLGAGRSERHLGRAFSGGLLLGIAFQIKFVIAVDVAFLVGLIAFTALGTGRSAEGAPGLAPDGSAAPRRLVAILGPMLLGFVLPSIAVVLYFAAHHLLRAYVYANFLANLHHADDRLKPRATLEFLASIVNAAPLVWGLALVAAAADSGAEQILRARALGVWLLLTLVAVLAPGQPYLHYALQTAVPAALLATFALDGLVLSKLPRPSHRQAVTFAALFAVYGAFVVPWSFAAKNLAVRVTHLGHQQPETIDEVATYLRPRLDGDRLIYVVDVSPIVYELADAKWPTRYLFPPFLADPHFSRTAGVDPSRELAAIKAQRPLYLIRRTAPLAVYSAFRKEADALFQFDYQPAATFDDIEILRRNGS